MARPYTDADREADDRAEVVSQWRKDRLYLQKGGVEVIPTPVIPLAHIETFCQLLESRPPMTQWPSAIADEIRKHLIHPYSPMFQVDMEPEDGILEEESGE